MRKYLPILFIVLFFNNCLISQDIAIEWAKIQGSHLIQIQYSGALNESDKSDIRIKPSVSIKDIQINQNIIEINTNEPLLLDTHYYLTLGNHEALFLLPDGILDSLYSDESMGYHKEDYGFVFRVFAPRAKWVRLALFENYDDVTHKEYAMNKDEDGVWKLFVKEDWNSKYYAYRIWGPAGEGEMFDSTIVIADPYSKAAVTKNEYQHSAKTLILPQGDFDWEGDIWMKIPMRDLIIYEMHIRDLTAHSSAMLPEGSGGYYSSLIREDQNGGLPYIRSLGVNTVELLPAQDFGNIEIPFEDHSAPVFNTWNPYERNHWGYMTSYFFAPESYYATGGTMDRGEYNGMNGSQVKEFKEMVKAFHKNGIAVIMDVVYNHVSEYDYNPLKYLDKFYYFQLNNDCSFTGVSGCGNDLKTERAMSRKMILESVKYWMEEYHIDGFRFDLALMIDKETCRQILKEARKINPNVIIIAEPWGGGYDPNGFSDIGWASWNDQIRNGVKGQNPHDGHGFIFGKFQGQNNRESLERYVKGSPRSLGGQYVNISHSINYLESHDDNTMGDFIRIGLGEVDDNSRIIDTDSAVRLTPLQLKLNKLAALFLLTSQGPVMIHEGQEFARSKIIKRTDVPDENWGKIDHNSYEKDNSTNYLNFNHAKINDELVTYYKGLIQVRKKYAAFRHAETQNIYFRSSDDPFFLIYNLNYDNEKFLVGLNGNQTRNYQIKKPTGEWEVLVDADNVYLDENTRKVSGEIMVPPASGFILKKRN